MANGNDTPAAPSGATARRALLGGAAVLGAAIAGVSPYQPVPAAAGADAELILRLRVAPRRYAAGLRPGV